MFSDVGLGCVFITLTEQLWVYRLDWIQHKTFDKKRAETAWMCCGSFHSPDPLLWDQLNESLLPDCIWTDVLALKTDLGSGCYFERLLSSSNFCVCIFIFAPTNLKPSGTIDGASSAKINSKAHTETPESFCHNTTFNHSAFFFFHLLHFLKNLNLSPPHRVIKSASLQRTIVGFSWD